MQNEPTTTKNLITDFELNELMAKIIDHCFNRWNEKELLIANRIKQFVADFLERKLANELDSANEQARADERKKVLAEVESWLPSHTRNASNQTDVFGVVDVVELRAKLVEMKGLHGI